MSNTRDYLRVERAIRFLDDNLPARPGLAEVARHVGLSDFHFQRLFRRWAGVSPKRFLQGLTTERARTLLAESRTVLSTSLELGLSGTGRLHDLLVAVEAMTPGELRRGGEGLEIRYGVHPTPFGPCLIAETARGVCGLDFLDGPDPDPAGLRQRLAASWPAAGFRQDTRATGRTAQRIFAPAGAPEPGLGLHLRGTNFQLQVWRALLRIPAGRVTTYGALAEALDRPGAGRAVAGAVAANRVGYLIPCHRVIRSTGAAGGYRWGPLRKQAMIAWEAGVTETVGAGR